MTNEEMNDIAANLSDRSDIESEMNSAMDKVMNKFMKEYNKLTSEWKNENPEEAERVEKLKEDNESFISRVNHNLVYNMD